MNLAELLASGAVTVNQPEAPPDARLRRYKDAVRFTLAWGFLAVIGGVASTTPKTSTLPDERHWAQTIVVSLATALGGYALGRSEHK